MTNVEIHVRCMFIYNIFRMYLMINILKDTYIILFITSGRHLKSSKVSLSPSDGSDSNSDESLVISDGSPGNNISNTEQIQVDIDNDSESSLNEADDQNEIVYDNLGNTITKIDL